MGLGEVGKFDALFTEVEIIKRGGVDLGEEILAVVVLVADEVATVEATIVV